MANNPDTSKRVDQPTGTEFVGHEWDGIEELNTPLPRWWLWTFYLTIVWALGYVIAYPAWPLVEKGTEGVLGWTSRGQLAEELATAEASKADIFARIAATPVENLGDDPALLAQAVAGGSAAFKVNCVQCHGAGAAGYQDLGYPNLNDDDWLWGGDLKAIEYTLIHGIRDESDPQTRFSLMPGFEGIFTPQQTSAVVDHVLSFTGQAQSSAMGAELYANNCLACHGPAGQGDRLQGAPNLADAIWLYGDSRAQITQQILNPRMGMMPRWSDKLDPVTIKMLTAYVHSRGGGEETPRVVVEAEAEAQVDEQS